MKWMPPRGMDLIEKLSFKMYLMGGGGMPDATTPQAPAPPPPPKPPPTKVDDDVENQKKEALDRKKFQQGREKTLLEQSTPGKKKTLLGT